MEGLFGEAVLPWIYSVGLLVLGTYAAVRPDLIRDVDVRVLLASLLVIAVVLCLLTTWWQSRCRSYRCSDCGHVFGAGTGAHLLGQNWFGSLRGNCPGCGIRSWFPQTDS